jgi:glycerol-3-phosphate dehydrogenase
VIVSATARERVGIIGGGSFGSALADILGTAGHDVTLWFRSAESATRFNDISTCRDCDLAKTFAVPPTSRKLPGTARWC